MENEKQSIYYTACGGNITQPELFVAGNYRDEIVYFCTAACYQAFLEDPDRFMAGEIEHPD